MDIPDVPMLEHMRRVEIQNAVLKGGLYTEIAKKPRCEEVYDIEEIIGEGTSSDVVSAAHNISKQKVAVKIIDKTKLKSEKQRWRVRNEVKLHRRACKSYHPHIVQFLEPYESDIDICLVLELCEGGELFNKIVERGYFTESEASKTIKQIASAIQHLHTMGIVHRDIKPENIIYARKDDLSIAKLADFGLAKQIDKNYTGKGFQGRALLKASLSGTTAYCAPERLNQAEESKAVDMWSLGCILYFVLFGVPPFYSNKEDEEENEDEICEAVLEGTVQFPEGRAVSDDAKDLILRLLEKDPSRRCTADQVLMHRWIKSHHEEDSAVAPKCSNSGQQDRALLKSSINRVIQVRSGSLTTELDLEEEGNNGQPKQHQHPHRASNKKEVLEAASTLSAATISSSSSSSNSELSSFLALDPL